MITINEQHLGTEATAAEARAMVDILTERGYPTQYGEKLTREGDENANAVPDDVWTECLNLAIARAQAATETTCSACNGTGEVLITGETYGCPVCIEREHEEQKLPPVIISTTIPNGHKWQVHACPEHKGKHPYHDHRYVTTAPFDEDGHGIADDGEIICSLRDTPNQKLYAQLIAAAPQLLAFAEMVRAGNTEYDDLQEIAASLVYLVQNGRPLTNA